MNSRSRSLYAIARPSVCRLERSCTLLSRLNFAATFLSHLVPWPSLDIRRKFYGDRPRGTSPFGELNTRGVAKYSDFGPIEGYISEKSYISFRLVPKSVTSNDLERRNGPYVALFHRTRVRCRRETITSVSKATFDCL